MPTAAMPFSGVSPPSYHGDAAGQLRHHGRTEDMDKHSLSHTSRECVYHIFWIPRYRRKVPYGEKRRGVGGILRISAERMDGVDLVEGSVRPDNITTSV